MTGAPAIRLLSPRDPDVDDRLGAAHDLWLAALRHDLPDDPLPSRGYLAQVFRSPWPAQETEVVVGSVGGTLVGWAVVELPTSDNRDVAVVEVVVHPAHRRRGVGRALWGAVRERMQAAGRARAVLETRAPDGPGEKFLRALGADRVLVEMRSVLDVAAEADAPLAALRAEAERHAAGYSLLRWVGATPPEHVEGAAALHARMSTDAPLQDLSWEAEAIDASRLRARERAMADRGWVGVTTAARHDSSGELAGFTEIVAFDDERRDVEQWETIVLATHRGHRLGLLLKAANLQLARRTWPGLRRIDTWNADTNTHMLAVNTRLGFRPLRQHAEWEIRLR